ncbi:hypothetical protein [Ensifer sp. 22564]|uniref:hypothetical protein n=1 Tax=unclassified Ensifer TaxID=2633371 RepID=UPI003F85D596
MADVSNTAIRATIQTREAADLADEHFVQHCISRPDVFIASASDMPAAGEIEASADIASSDVATVRSLGDAGALRVSRH